MVLAIIQARLTSKRFPNKVLQPIGEKTMLQHVIDRVSKSLVDKVVVASPHTIPFKGADSFIGSEDDVLDRYYQCAKKYKADIIVRITADCPLIDPEVIDYAIGYFKKHRHPYIIIAPVDGLDVEVFNFWMLRRTWRYATRFSDREHVTPFMQRVTKLSVDTEENLKKVRDYAKLSSM